MSRSTRNLALVLAFALLGGASGCTSCNGAQPADLSEGPDQSEAMEEELSGDVFRDSDR